eukprot:1037256-Pleurochrysis_carterae.AAC.1
MLEVQYASGARLRLAHARALARRTLRVETCTSKEWKRPNAKEWKRSRRRNGSDRTRRNGSDHVEGVEATEREGMEAITSKEWKRIERAIVLMPWWACASTCACVCARAW